MRVARFAVLILFAATTALLALPAAQAAKRVALVIGNGAYQNVGKLANPTNDARAIAGMLQAAGFDAKGLQLHENLGIRDMRRAINAFADSLRDSDVAVVYYSGHGMEVNGVNYLIPIDATLDRDTDVPYETVSLDNLVQVMEPARRLRLVVLDACRDNPFVRTMRRTVGGRAVGRGLAPVEPTSLNTLIGYAAKAGSIALDGDGANSPYAIALLNNLATPGLDLRIAFGQVRDEVLELTRNKQEPFVYGSLGGGNISIVDTPGDSSLSTTPQITQVPVLDRAGQVWLATKDTTSIAVLEDFIMQFGSTPYESMARARLAELKKSQVAVVASPISPTQPPTRMNPPGKPVTSISGKWIWKAACEDGKQWNGEFNFDQKSDGSLGGTCVNLTPGKGPCSSISGQVTGTKARFSVRWNNVLGLDSHWNPFNFTIAGDGLSMRGTERSKYGGICTYQVTRR